MCKQSCIHKNKKTYRSLDFTTICPKKAEGKPCSYCYVEQGRKNGFWYSKKEHNELPYTGEIARMSQDTIDKLNECGGLRVFSFADYEPWQDKYLLPAILHAKARGLKLKAITKIPEFIDKWGSYFDVIHLSIVLFGKLIDQPKVTLSK